MGLGAFLSKPFRDVNKAVKKVGGAVGGAARAIAPSPGVVGKALNPANLKKKKKPPMTEMGGGGPMQMMGSGRATER